MSPVPGRRKFLVLTDRMVVLGILKVYFFWLTIHLLFLSIQNVLCLWLTAHSIFVLCRPDVSCFWCDGRNVISFLGKQNICPRRSRRLLLLARQNVLANRMIVLGRLQYTSPVPNHTEYPLFLADRIFVLGRLDISFSRPTEWSLILADRRIFAS